MQQGRPMKNDPASPPLNKQPEPRASLLLVDDQPANLLALEAILEDLGHDLVQAASGEEALRQVLDRDFAVILLDVQMHGLDGFETAKLIRGRKRSRHTPIIFLTAHDDNRLSVAEAYALGAVDYLVKPLLSVVLRAKVKGFIELFQKTEQVKRQAEQLRQLERRQFEQKLAEENARFRALTEHSSDAVSLIHPDGTVVYNSPSTRRILGYEPDEFLRRNGFELVHPDDRETIRRRLAELTDQPGIPIMVELRVRHKDGSWRWVECVGTNLLGEPAVAAIVVNFRDSTERRQATEALRHSEHRFAQFMRYLPGLAWIKDLAGRYVYVNESAETTFGMPRAQLYGQTDEDIFPPEVAAQFRENDQRALGSAMGVQVIETLTHEDGILHHSLVAKFPIPGPNGEPNLVGGMAVDITEQKRAQAVLEEADRRKDEFLAMLAHELRNPLASIRNAVHILRLLTEAPPRPLRPASPAAQPGDPNLRQARDTIERQVQHLTRLVDDLLDVSRIQRGKVVLRFERLDVAELARITTEDHRPAIEQAGLVLDLKLPSGPVWVQGDPTRLTQVLGNLLQNAVKFSDRGGQVAVQVTVEPRPHKAEATTGKGPVQAVLSVRDTGVGIEQAMLSRVFETFSQADRSLERSKGGLGLGLALVKGLVELHGGEVHATSAGPGRGAAFIVRLPSQPELGGPGEPMALSKQSAGAPRPQRADAAQPASKRCRVLVVEDNKDAADSLRTLLELFGHEVAVACSGLVGVQMAISWQPDVVLCDIGLPGLDGYAVVSALRRNPVTAKARVIAVTGYGADADRLRSREAGFDLHLTKPVDPDELLALFRGLESGAFRA
jgi:PAS domain S-box-containing protein